MPAVCFYDSCPNKLIFYIVIHLFNLLFSHSPIYSFSPSPFLPLTLSLPHASRLTPHISHLTTRIGELRPGSSSLPASFASLLLREQFQGLLFLTLQISTSLALFCMQNSVTICTLHKRQ